MTQTEATVVRKQVVVNAAITQAFTAFTERFGDFKPPEHNLLQAPIAETVFEPRVGGHIYDRAADGSDSPGHDGGASGTLLARLTRGRGPPNPRWPARGRNATSRRRLDRPARLVDTNR